MRKLATGLQSNHYGIEIQLLPPNQNSPTPSCNRTIMVLKSILRNLYPKPSFPVAIEPLWY